MKFKYLLLILLFSSISLSAESKVLLKHKWQNISYENAKDSIMAGATTATAKGYSALLSNPAGLGSNYAVGLYARATIAQRSIDNDTTINDKLGEGEEAIGLFYKHFIVEKATDVHTAMGFGYGYETNYGLFSLGVTRVKDETTGFDTEGNSLERGTGDYDVYGFQWQKSFIGIEDFYAVYFGYAVKGLGLNLSTQRHVGVVSPLVKKLGVAFETNIYSSSILISYDKADESWQGDDALVGTISYVGYGLKWMVWDGFAISLGQNTGTYSGNAGIKDVVTQGAGIEISFWQVNVSIAATVKETTMDSYIVKDESAHVDISFAF
jgi:hypothetical protein